RSPFELAAQFNDYHASPSAWNPEMSCSASDPGLCSPAAVGVAHDQSPRSVGLSAEHLDRLELDLAGRSRIIHHRTLKVGVQHGDVTDCDHLDDSTLQARF